MTEETLKYFVALQPRFREVMKEQLHDKDERYICPNGVEITTSRRNCSERCLRHNEHCYNEKFIFCPLPIDPRNPERGLWGMVDWNRFYGELNGPNGEIAIFECPFISFNEEMGIPVKDHPFISAQPELALLKALAYQWGIDVI